MGPMAATPGMDSPGRPMAGRGIWMLERMSGAAVVSSWMWAEKSLTRSLM